MSPTRDFLVWLAGFVDGEGCITTLKAPHSAWGLRVYQSGVPGERIVNEIKDTLNLGTISHRPSRGHSQDEWSFNVSRRNDLIWLLAKLLPYLKIKKERAIEALEYLRNNPPIKRYEKMKFWTDAEINNLRDVYPSKGAMSLASTLGRSIVSVQAKAYTLGLHVNDRHRSQEQSEKAKHRTRDRFGQFWKSIENQP